MAETLGRKSLVSTRRTGGGQTGRCKYSLSVVHGTIAVRSKYFLSSSREEGGDVRLANIADPSRHSFVTEHTLHRTVHHYMVQGRTDPIRVLAYKGLAMCVWCKYSLDFYRKYTR